ncbi:MAG: hypothetical protein NVSMB23_21720 [Myxococcales bacterium]
MPAQIDPLFLTAWVRAELETLGDPQLPAALRSLAARGVQDGLDEDEAELDAAGQIAERRGLLEALERAAGDLWLAEVREARGQGERLQRGSDPARSSVVATLRASAGAADRLARLARALERDPQATIAELTSSLGGTPGCSVR